MYHPAYYCTRFVLLLLCLGLSLKHTTEASPTSSTTSAPQPAYQPQESAASGYIPHATYPYAESYGPVAPYQGYLYPAPNQGAPGSHYLSSLIPAVQFVFQVALKFLSKLGFLAIFGVGLFLVGGAFTAVVCSLTPFCTITFPVFGGFDNDAMRSLMTPDRISTAAALVQDAIGKYQRLQRAVNK